VKLYRTMKIAPDGKPLVGKKRNMLGVRPTDPTNRNAKAVFDVPAINDTDAVSPGKGLSTSLDPAILRVDPGEAIFVIDTADIDPELKPNPDNPPHCLLQPATTITLGELQHALEDTRDLWKPVQEGGNP